MNRRRLFGWIGALVGGAAAAKVVPATSASQVIVESSTDGVSWTQVTSYPWASFDRATMEKDGARIWQETMPPARKWFSLDPEKPGIPIRYVDTIKNTEHG
jgi:hypothetical protein